MTYTGNSAYCFTNTLHMSLQAAGMQDVPPQWFLESLTLMPFGTTFFDFGEDWLFLPSGAGVDPDDGLDIALEALGWAADDNHGGDAAAALDRLRPASPQHPIHVGPVDFGYLSYHPLHKEINGTDHFVLVLEANDEWVRVHDPDQVPYGKLPTGDFMQAWQATALHYGKRPYQMRSNFRQIESRSRQQIIESILPKIRQTMTATVDRPNVSVGAQAFEKLAECCQGQITEAKRMFLIHFALPLGARRCVDGAAFLERAGLKDAATCMNDKTKSYGEGVYYAVHQQWDRLTDTITHMAEIETKLIAAISR